MNKPDPIPARLAALKTATTPELKQQWRDLFDGYEHAAVMKLVAGRSVAALDRHGQGRYGFLLATYGDRVSGAYVRRALTLTRAFVVAADGRRVPLSAFTRYEYSLIEDRVRHRGARTPGRAHPHAGGAPRRELDLLDLLERRPRLGRLRALGDVRLDLETTHPDQEVPRTRGRGSGVVRVGHGGIPLVRLLLVRP